MNIELNSIRLLQTVPEKYQVTIKRYSHKSNRVDITNPSLKTWLNNNLPYKGVGYLGGVIGKTVYSCQISKRPPFYALSVNSAISQSVNDFKNMENNK